MKYIKPLILCIFIGFSMGFFLYNGYEKAEKTIPALKEENQIKFIKIGKYDNEQKMETTLKNIDYYIYKKEGTSFTAYVGITEKENNAKKIKDYYQSLGYITSIETYPISNKTFLSVLKTYDEMLEKTEDKDVTRNIISGVLSKYEECENDEH